VYLDPGERPSLTPQLAMRVAILGGIALLAFAFVFFRLWYLQVLSGDTYRAEANDNRVRAITVRAPRGEIVDRDGRVLVENRVALAVKVSPKELPEDRAARREVYERLGKVLGMRPGGIERRVEKQLRELPYATATVKQDVDQNIVAYLMEHRADFPGVEPERVFVRQYPQGETGAHLFGYTGEISPDDIEAGSYPGVPGGDLVGRGGIEQQYDRFLRGRNGASRVQVDAMGTVRGEPLKAEPPEQGRQLRLAIDLDVQEAGQAALLGRAGGFVAMDIRSGEVAALGSGPSFDPNFFSKPFSQAAYDRLNSDDYGRPLFNRAIQAGYPSGSTFKLVTAAAALEGGLITPEDVIVDNGSIRIGDIDFINAGRTPHGPVALRQALSVSSDIYFYLLGQKAETTGDGLLIQRWARKLGIGRDTGIDLPSEAPGRIPTPAWRADWLERGLTDRPWTVGDNVNFSIGQGDLLTNPLQMAIAYAAVANGGKVVKPHIGLRIEDSTGRPLQELATPPARRVKIAPEHRQAILDGIHSAANDPGGTSTPVFETFPVEIAGKTGTAETPQGDQSWYVALAPYPNPRYVVAATIEQGGFGAESAAPAVRQILTALLDVDDTGEVVVGTAQD
jgi:penicillin-binding protein 2